MNFRPMRTIGGTNVDNAKWDALYAKAMATLEQRIEEMDIPRPSRMPLQDVVVVYRIPNEYRGVIALPEEFKDRHDSPYSVGVFICAGAEAMDVLESHGVLPGDFVTFARWAGDEVLDSKIKEAVSPKSPENPNGSTSPVQAINRARELREEAASDKKKLLKLKTPDIQESIDAYERLHGDAPTMEMVRHVDSKGRVIHLILPI